MKNKITTTIDKVLERLDVLAEKLGIAAKEIWRFSVAAKVTEAKSNLAKAVLKVIFAILFTGWATHVAFTKIPHKTHQETAFAQSAWHEELCPESGNKKRAVIIWGNCFASDTPQKIGVTTVDDGLSDYGIGLAVSGLVAGIFAFFYWVVSIEEIIDALADLHTTEYDAYQDIIDDWKN